MEQIKTKFHKDLSDWEHLLAEYKQEFPKNYGAVVRKYLPHFMMMLGVMLFANTYSIQADEMRMAPCLISPVLFVFGLILYTRKDKAEPESIVPTLEQRITKAENTYSKYPDVVEYLKQFRTAIADETKRKNNIPRNFWRVFWCFFIVYGLIIAFQFVNNSDNRLRNYNINDNIGSVLKLEADVPFLTLTPYKTDISAGINLETKSLAVFLYSPIYDDSDLRCFITRKPKISGGSGQFRLIFTDENGNFIPRCPYFVFDSDGKDVIKSCYLQYDTRVKFNDLQTIETLRYLQDNKEHLRFIVEKK